MNLKTFKEVRETTEVYPSNIGMTDSDIEAINSWFDFRLVCDNEKFPVFFGRVLTRDYKRYRELLRVEPGVSHYDWLVQQYQEAQTQATQSGESTTTGETTAENTTTTEGENTVTVIKHTEGENTFTHDTEERTQGTVTTTKDGTDTTDIGDGGYTETTNSGTDRNTSTDGGRDTTHSETTDDTKQLNKDLPQSITYNAGHQASDALGWQYPSSQGETYDETESDGYTAYGRTNTSETTHGHKVRTVTDLTNRTTYDTTDEATTDMTMTKGGTDTTETSGDETGTTTDNREESTTGSGTTTTEGHTENSGESLTRQITTGRSVDTATLLTQAVQFIQNTSAMAWLIRELEVCFYGIFEEE